MIRNSVRLQEELLRVQAGYTKLEVRQRDLVLGSVSVCTGFRTANRIIYSKGKHFC